MLHELIVDPTERGERLDVVLERRLDGCSRSLVARCIKEGRCRIDPGKTKPGYRLRGGEHIVIEVPEIEPLEAVPEDLPLSILWEDEHYLAIDKTPGMVVHPAIGHPRGTLVNALLGYLGHQGGGLRPGLIHRLDADTSGVILVAKDPTALAAAQDAFRRRQVKKCYCALLAGRPRADTWGVDAWLGRHPKDFRRRAVLPADSRNAKTASTRFVVRQQADGYAVAEARPHTGRTHQIRVHAAHGGHPILADAVYGRSRQWPLSPRPEQPVLQRQALHAWRLRLQHPLDDSELDLQAPIPADLQAWVEPGLTPLD